MMLTKNLRAIKKVLWSKKLKPDNISKSTGITLSLAPVTTSTTTDDHPAYISALPNEILCAIFNALLSDIWLAAEKSAFEGELLYTTRPFQVVASRVCRSWRALVMSTPTLWANIIIQVYGVLAHNWNSTNRVLYFLRNSEPAPLNIFFDTRTSYTETVLQHETSQLLSQHMKRIRSLQIWVSGWLCLERVFQDLHEVEAPELQKLDIWLASVPTGSLCETCEGTPTVTANHAEGDLIWTQPATNIPRLTTLKTTNFCVMDLPLPPSLTHLDMNCPVLHPKWLSTVFDSTPNLEILVLRGLRDRPRPMTTHHEPSVTNPTTLPHLHSLGLEFADSGPNAPECLLPHLLLPKLSHMEISLPLGRSNLTRTTSESLSRSSCLSALVERCSSLRLFTNNVHEWAKSPLISSLPPNARLEVVGVPVDVVDVIMTLVGLGNVSSIGFEVDEEIMSTLPACLDVRYQDSSMKMSKICPVAAKGASCGVSMEETKSESTGGRAPFVFLRRLDNPTGGDSDVAQCLTNHVRRAAEAIGNVVAPPIHTVPPDERSMGDRLLDARWFLSSMRDEIKGHAVTVVLPRRTLMPEYLTSLSTEDYSRGKLPGFVRPVNYVPEPNDPDYVGPLFPNALINDLRHLQQLTTVREFAMMAWMEEVCNKPDWHVKVNDPDITKTWKEETLAAHDERTFSSSMVDYCISELKDRAKAITDPNKPPPYLVFDAGVYRSDTAVSLDLKKEIQDAVAEFESRIPEKQKDWHPHSDDKVWDLVHPSLFPLVYGKSRILLNGETVTLEDCIAKCGMGETIPKPANSEIVVRGSSSGGYWSSEDGLSYSKRFQWLPCEVDIKGSEAKITSYINNLHPAYNKRLYDIIERVITAAIPLWELTLARIDQDERPALRVDCDYAEYDREKTSDTDSDPDKDPNDDEGGEERQTRVRPPPRKLVYPEPFPYLPGKEVTPLNLHEKYGDRVLQVIVKLANICLTPEKPEYAGGTWHVEGQLNEHIVSTALYYYSNENITQSTLSFRQQIDTEDCMVDLNYGQDDHDWLEGYFGCTNEKPGIQAIGSIRTSEGRLVTFPNTLQHRVGPFKLEDPTKPGHRKIIALFLVDPNIKIVSTANVPCQRRDWWWELVTAQRSSSGSATPHKPQGLEKLPVELQQHVFEDVDDFPLSLKVAKKLRLKLMEERTAFADEQNAEFEESFVLSVRTLSGPEYEGPAVRCTLYK